MTDSTSLLQPGTRVRITADILAQDEGLETYPDLTGVEGVITADEDGEFFLDGLMAVLSFGFESVYRVVVPAENGVKRDEEPGILHTDFAIAAEQFEVIT